MCHKLKHSVVLKSWGDLTGKGKRKYSSFPGPHTLGMSRGVASIRLSVCLLHNMTNISEWYISVRL